MFGSAAFDVVLSLILIYLLYSLFTSIIAETLVGWLGMRARLLRVAIEKMLNDDLYEKNEKKKGFHLQEYWRKFFLYEPEEFKDSFAGLFYAQPSIKYLTRVDDDQKGVFGLSKPSYISTANFATTLIHLLRKKGIGKTDQEKINFSLRFNPFKIRAETLRHLRDLERDAGNDINMLQSNLEDWFDETMDRTNGWYKRKLQFILFWLGFVIAFAFNIDTISIAQKLLNNKAARDQMGAMAVAMAQSSSLPATDSDKNTLDSALKSASDSLAIVNQILGLGWKKVQKAEVHIGVSEYKLCFKMYNQINPLAFEFWGILITAFALSLGAPFWFDLLKKFVAIRASGVKPEAPKLDSEPKGVDKKINDVPIAVVRPSEGKGDVVDEILKVYRPQLLQIPGVKSVFSLTKSAGSRTTKRIQINVENTAVRKEIQQRFSTLDLLGLNTVPTVVISGSPQTQQSILGMISNKSGLNGAGSLGCVLTNKNGKTQHLLSCWHVMKGNLEYDRDDNQRTILDAQQQEVGVRWAGGIDKSLDYALAQCTVDLNNTMLAQRLGFKSIGIGYRPVTDVDINTNAAISYFDLFTNRPVNGVIYTDSPSVEIRYADRSRIVDDVLLLTTKATGTQQPISQRGNSGSIVFDDKGKALGMIIAGDDLYSYAMKLNHFFSIHDDLTLV